MCLWLFLFTILSCNNKQSDISQNEKVSKLIDSCARYVKSGDMVLRSGNSFTSTLLSSFNTKDKSYSHVGVLMIEEGIPCIYHSIGGESNPNAAIRKESIKSWCNPSFNSGFAVIRYNLDSTAKSKFLDIIRAYYKNEVKFDMNFDLNTDTSLYCTEMVYKAIGNAIGNSSWLTPSKIANKYYVGVDDLFLDSSAKFICKVNYK